MAYKVTICPIETEAPDVIMEAEEVTFINGGSYGSPDRFGIGEGFEGSKVFINVNAFTTAEIEVV